MVLYLPIIFCNSFGTDGTVASEDLRRETAKQSVRTTVDAENISYIGKVWENDFAEILHLLLLMCP